MALKLGKKRLRLNSFQVATFGFAGVILMGALLLMLPISSVAGVVTPFVDALFTSTTAVCVTGLVVQDTGTYWTVFGQGVILVLIQIGGLGVVTIAASIAMLSGRKLGLMQRSTMQDAVAAPKISGIARLTVFIVITTLCIELLGAVVMAPVFCRDFGLGQGLWMAVFHSISAFCNAGIDLMGIREPYSSLTSYVGNPVINLTIMTLIVVGGIGFLTWDDVRTNGVRLDRYRLQSKVILLTTGLLILVPAVGFFFVEFSDMPLGQRILSSLFQSVTPRTAGFNTVDLTAMTQAGQMTLIILMLIGGSPGSTAGGMKTTTFAVILACAVSVFRRRDSAHVFKRRIGHDVVATALTLSFMYVGLCVGCGMAISLLEDLPVLTCMYETASAVATVGLTLGITPQLGTISKAILIALMYLGRVGGLTLIYAALSGQRTVGRLPLEKITVG